MRTLRKYRMTLTVENVRRFKLTIYQQWHMKTVQNNSYG